MSWLRALWAFVRELSGEAALERRMARLGDHAPSCRAKVAMGEASAERPRCC